MSKTTHTYEVEVKTPEGKIIVVRYLAFSRDQAARNAARAGYEVRSVNMVG